MYLNCPVQPIGMTLVLRHVSLRLAGSCLSGSREGINSIVSDCLQVLHKPGLKLGGSNLVRVRPQRCTHASVRDFLKVRTVLYSQSALVT